MSENKTNSSNVLRLTDITMQFGGVVAINNLSLDVNQGEIVALIGPNGAGKTTAFNCVTGVYEPTNGMVYFHGKPIVVNHPQGKMVKQYGGINADKYKDRKPVVYTPDKITRMGIARTFQNIRLFKSQTAFENVLIGTHLRRTSNFLTATFRLNAKEEAGGGHEPPGNGRAGRVHCGDQEQVRPDGLHDRAPYEPGHGHLGPDLCAGLRQADR